MRSLPLQRVAQWLVLALAAILPIAHTTALRNILFWSAVLITAIEAVRRHIRPTLPVPLAWLAYAAAAALSVPFALNVEYSAGEFKSEVVYCALAMMLGATWIQNQTDLMRLVRLMVFIAAIAGVVGLADAALQLAAGRAIHEIIVAGTHTGMGTYSTYLVSVAPMAMLLVLDDRQGNRTLGIVALTLVLLATAVTRNRIAVVVLVAESALFLWMLRHRFRWRRTTLVGAAVGLCALLATFVWQLALRSDSLGYGLVQSLRLDTRWEIYSLAWNTLNEHPWTGTGFGRRAFTYANREFVIENKLFWHAHNALLNKGVQMGWVGIAAFSWLMAATATAFFPRRPAGVPAGDVRALSACAFVMLVGVMLKNMTDDFFVRDHALLFWLLSGAFAATISTASAPRAATGGTS
jgi:O-antigen ligase